MSLLVNRLAPCFECEVNIKGRHFPSAWGTNKKEAEQKAAFNALVELGVVKEDAHNHHE
jgi:dsRNA-specific ribonuclease